MVAAMFAFIWLLRDTYPLASLAIVGFVVASHAWNHEAWSDLGFRLKGAWRPFREFAAYLGVLVALLLVGGVVFDSFRAMPLAAGALGLLLYCAWGLCQQYLLNGFFVNRVARIAEGRVAALAGACAFSLVHLPNWFLMAVCLVGGWASATFYRTHRNLWFLGVCHGVLGFLLYLVVPDSVTHQLCVGPNYFTWRAVK